MKANEIKKKKSYSLGLSAGLKLYRHKAGYSSGVFNAALTVSHHFDLPTNAEKTIKTCRTKNLMKAALMGAHIPVVQKMLITQ